MGSQMKWMSIALLVLIALFGLNSFQQSKYNASSDQIFDLERDSIFAFEIIKGQEFVLLLFDGENSPAVKWMVIGLSSVGYIILSA